MVFLGEILCWRGCEVRVKDKNDSRDKKYLTGMKGMNRIDQKQA
jgi:hypothetical protein